MSGLSGRKAALCAGLGAAILWLPLLGIAPLISVEFALLFPALRGIDLDYSWWGWVDVSHDMMPRITGLPDLPGAYYALGYGGNGVMYSAMAGRRMAQLVAGEAVPDLPIFNSELPHEGWKTPFRRLGQRGLYHLYHYRDERK